MSVKKGKKSIAQIKQQSAEKTLNTTQANHVKGGDGGGGGVIIPILPGFGG